LDTKPASALFSVACNASSLAANPFSMSHDCRSVIRFSTRFAP
jgi:hypothetical protein